MAVDQFSSFLAVGPGDSHLNVSVLQFHHLANRSDRMYLLGLLAYDMRLDM